MFIDYNKLPLQSTALPTELKLDTLLYFLSLFVKILFIFE